MDSKVNIKSSDDDDDTKCAPAAVADSKAIMRAHTALAANCNTLF
jgi:hypothetical protein